MNDQPIALRRAVGPIQLTLYGVGSMLGAGIYALVGEAAGELGSMVWAGFLVAMIAALLTALSYASVASRYPKAAGAAYAAHRAYRSPFLSWVVGLAVVCSGLSSMATGSRAVSTNLWALFGGGAVSTPLVMSLLAGGYLMIVAAIVYRGIRESLWFNALCTVIEAGGLLFIIAIGARFWGSADLTELPPQESTGAAITGLLILQGAVLTFFSFIGFEDLLNVSEEAKDPRRTVPIALIASMLIASFIYMAVSITAVSVVPWRELSETQGAPLTEVVRRAAPWFPSWGFTVLTIFAVANTALINYIMGSRLLYGLATQGLAPSPLGKVHPRRRTPHIAIATLLVVALILAMVGEIGQLAASTVLLLLMVFVVVNVGLVRLTLREGKIAGAFNIPVIIPILATVICSVLLVVRVARTDWSFFTAAGGDLPAPVIAGGLFVLITVLYLATGKGRAERLAAYWEQEEEPKP